VLAGNCGKDVREEVKKKCGEQIDMTTELEEREKTDT